MISSLIHTDWIDVHYIRTYGNGISSSLRAASLLYSLARSLGRPAANYREQLPSNLILLRDLDGGRGAREKELGCSQNAG